MNIRSQNPDAETVVMDTESKADVTISHEEYQSLKSKAQDVEELAKKRVALAMAQVPPYLLHLVVKFE